MTDLQREGSRRECQARLIVCVLACVATFDCTHPAVAKEGGVIHLRVTDHDATRQVGTFLGLQGDTLLLVDRSKGEPRSIPLSRIETVERSRGRHGHILAGAGIGLGTGVILGVAIGAAQSDESVPFFGRPNYSAIGAFYLGLGGAVVGALAGTLWQSESWRPIPMKDLHVMVGLSGTCAPEIIMARQF